MNTAMHAPVTTRVRSSIASATSSQRPVRIDCSALYHSSIAPRPAGRCQGLSADEAGARFSSPLQSPRLLRRRLVLTQAESGQGDSSDGSPRTKGTEFGYSRKDILLVGGGLIALGYAMYYGLQAFGVEPLFAGNVVQLTIFVGICVGYISTYVFRVANKEMTYVKQLEEYEEAVMRKRLAEMPEEDVERLMREVEEEGPIRADKRRRFLEAQQRGEAPKL